MSTAVTSLTRRVAYLLHLGFVEVRALAYARAPHEQIADLADALEVIAKYAA